ncbi:MAG: DUF1844 domain-containing protein [Desulfurivibrionaceae bacterium]|nr:DUF1844 domain-containing protein [Desulfobulbales bacterium]MDT8334843.1 DUF1844 domain-containing protein [Desulfurivibrionaceae bacterium]
MDKAEEGRKCPEGQVLKDGKCVMPEVSFNAFVMSLNTAALYHCGELADPETGETHKELVLAKHAIDTLDLLKKKTAGNLTRDEENLLETVLYDLKLRYVKLAG